MDPPIDTRQLKAFHVLAREGSFTRAGQALHLTQSAISHAIKALEAELGCQLFYRQGKRVFLTHHGRELLAHAEAIESHMAQARSALGALDQTPRGRLRIGTTTAAAQFVLPTVLREFKESFPLYSISVVPGETPETVQRLRNNELDLSICLKPHDVAALDCHHIFSDELEFLVSHHHAWMAHRPKPREIAEQTFIVSSRQSYTFQLITQYFLKQSIRLSSFIELGSNEAIKELVKLGLGVGISARWTAQTEIEAGQLCTLSLPKGRIRRDWVVARLKQRPLNLAERTFLGLCEEVGTRIAV
ncbi:MAG: LysR family transcriptional regulator [Verrucomicrobiales bacterium]